MKLTRPTELAALLARHAIRPSKRLGQNFLIDDNVRRLILDAAAVAPDETVLEIGPGPGALTELLLERAGRVVAIEKDRKLAALLQERLGDHPKLDLRVGDALDEDLEGLAAGPCRKVVSNLPYASGTRILVRFLHAPRPPAVIAVTLQLDVAARLTALPDGAAYGLLAVWAQRLYTVSIERKISPSCFFPPPDVQSAFVVLHLRPAPLAQPRSSARFIALTRHAFTQRRKQMVNVLERFPAAAGGPRGDPKAILAAAGIDPAARPGEIGIEAWCRLADALPEKENGPDAV